MHRSREEVGRVLEAFLTGESSKWEWDDFLSIKIDDAELDRARRLCNELPELYPPERKGVYCGAGGFEIIARLRDELQGGE